MRRRTSQLILSKVRKLLPAKDNIELSRIEKLYLADLSHVDLIITSVDLDNINVPYVRVSPVVTNEDYININYILILLMIMHTRQL